jgi:hypothetical protein
MACSWPKNPLLSALVPSAGPCGAPQHAPDEPREDSAVMASETDKETAKAHAGTRAPHWLVRLVRTV